MQKLNFPSYSFRFKNNENNRLIFDVIRKKFVVLNPEEWVRQHTIHYLIYDLKYPPSLINVEKQLKLFNTKKRYDIVVYNPDGSINIIVECKSPQVGISQEVFDQVARYNLALNASYLMITNGIDHFFCRMDFNEKKYQFLKELPPYLPKEK